MHVFLRSARRPVMQLDQVIAARHCIEKNRMVLDRTFLESHVRVVRRQEKGI